MYFWPSIITYCSSSAAWTTTGGSTEEDSWGAVTLLIGTTGAIVVENNVCWLGISAGMMYNGVFVPAYKWSLSFNLTAVLFKSE